MTKTEVVLTLRNLAQDIEDDVVSLEHFSQEKEQKFVNPFARCTLAVCYFEQPNNFD